MTIDTRTLGEPVNSTAGRVIAKGFSHEWVNKQRPHVKSWKSQPATREPLRNAPDYSGVKFGRMEVVGLSQEFKKRWVARCACGIYELRSAKAIKKELEAPEVGTASNGMCSECMNLMAAKKKEAKHRFFRKHGFYPDESNGPEARKFMEKYG